MATSPRTTTEPAPFLRVHPSFFIMTFMMGASRGGQPILMIEWFLVVFVSIVVHECGHALAAQSFGHPPRIELHGMGGTTYWTPTTRINRFEMVLIALAGPFAGFVLGGLVWFVSRHFGLDQRGDLVRTLVTDALWVNIGWGLLNLLPLLPLDGGQVMYNVLDAVTGGRGHRPARWISLVVAIGAVVAALLASMPFAAILAAYYAVENGKALRSVPGAEPAPAKDRTEAAAVSVSSFNEALQRGDGALATSIAKQLVGRSTSPKERADAALLLGYGYLAEGKLATAQIIVDTMLGGDSHDGYLEGSLALARGDHDRAIEQLTGALQSAPNPSTAQQLLKALVGGSKLDDAMALARGPQRENFDRGHHHMIDAALFGAGRFAEAAALGEQMFERWKTADDAYNVACSLARMGRHSDAITWLRHALAAGYTDATQFDTDSDLDTLRAHPEYAGLRERLGRPAAA